MIHTTHIAHTEDESNAIESWAERFKRYNEQAREDFEFYAWLEKQGKLPPPHRIGPGTVRKWQAARGRT